jgi:hypothetical protein
MSRTPIVGLALVFVALVFTAGKAPAQNTYVSPANGYVGRSYPPGQGISVPNPPERDPANAPAPSSDEDGRGVQYGYDYPILPRPTPLHHYTTEAGPPRATPYPYYHDPRAEMAAARPPEPTSVVPVVPSGAATLASPREYRVDAMQAFRNGDYGSALRLAARANSAYPSDPQNHLLVGLAEFALGDYVAASSEAHATLTLAPMPAWATVQTFYNDPADYTPQLRALEAYVALRPKDASGRFLLGFHYAMLGYGQAASNQFAAALSETPSDTVAQNLVARLGGAATRGLSQPSTGSR